MSILKLIDIFLLSTKTLSLVCCTVIFGYWSILAIEEFKSGPVTSTVSYTFGDDGHGNYAFPAITICLNSFKKIINSPNGMKNKCTGRPEKFYMAVKKCTSKNEGEKNEETTEGGGMFGNIFDEEPEEKIVQYSLIENLLNTSKMIDPADILTLFAFDYIQLMKNQNDEEWREILKNYWEPTLHYEKGFCFTFDPKDHEMKLVRIFGNQITPKLQFRLGFRVINTECFVIQVTNITFITSYAIDFGF